MIVSVVVAVVVEVVSVDEVEVLVHRPHKAGQSARITPPKKSSSQSSTVQSEQDSLSSIPKHLPTCVVTVDVPVVVAVEASVTVWELVAVDVAVVVGVVAGHSRRP